MKIVLVPEKVLLKKAKIVTEFGMKLAKQVEDMKKTLDACVDPVGVGLAAPQVGLSECIFLMKPTPKSFIQVFINPEIVSAKTTQSKTVKKNDDEGEPLEGCLSIPRIWGPIQRASEVKLRWVDIHGKQYEKTFTGFEAAIIQHEVDHLNGILFTHRLAEQKAPIYEERDKKLHELL
jgi:peptide deformylase